MTTRTTRFWCFSSLALLTVAALAPRAEAQCLPGSAFCAQVSIGGSVSVGGYYDVAPAPPPMVIVQPPPPPVYIVQPPPPPPPPPPMVVYQPQPVYQPPPVYYGGGYQQQPPMMQQPQRDPRFGVHLELGYMGTDRISMGGGAVAVRFRPGPAFALDLGIGTFGGQDYNGNGRVEVPLTLNGLFFFNPQDRVQVYGLVGLGVDWASVDGSRFGGGTDYTYFGGQIGIGVEWRISRWFALNTDLRGFLRTRIDGNTSSPEFTDPSTGNTTNTSVGLYGTLGATLYW